MFVNAYLRSLRHNGPPPLLWVPVIAPTPGSAVVFSLPPRRRSTKHRPLLAGVGAPRVDRAYRAFLAELCPRVAAFNLSKFKNPRRVRAREAGGRREQKVVAVRVEFC
jgi:hypothetical protein